MDALQSQNSQGSQSDKEAITSLCGVRIQDRNLHIFPQEDLPSKPRELRQLRIQAGRLNESNSFAEEKETTEIELSQAKIEETNDRACSQRLGLQLIERSREELHYAEEFDKVKQELSGLKLDMVSASEAKPRFQKEIEISRSKERTNLHSVEEMRKKIDEVKRDQEQVDLACIEVEGEFQRIEAQRETEAALFAKNIETAKKKIKKLRRELKRSKEIETKLSITNAEVTMLQSEMEFVRAMEKNYQIEMVNKAKKKADDEDSDMRKALKSVEVEFREAKEQLASFEEECFQFMTSMDLTRKELIQIAEDTVRLKKLGKRTELRMQHLNSKVSKSKSKLEAAAMAGERAEAIVSSLSAGLLHMQTEIEAAKNDKHVTDEETGNIKAGTEKRVLEIRSAEERLQAAMKELEAAKTSESMALKKLRNVAHRTMGTRVSSIPHSSIVIVSRNEYEYLNQQAAITQAVASKKLEATQAWIQALAAREEEVMTRAEFIERQIKELKTMEGEKNNKVEQNEDEKNLADKKSFPVIPRKSTKLARTTASSRRVKMRRFSTSLATPNVCPHHLSSEEKEGNIQFCQVPR
ncbi:hypothetical protein Cni_G12700 [Canna indica]|uniref:WEB family protein n=1 Tax=Canna indica TaxID=4628 RepID=A0AAQ3K9W5_9LILI|nr:hypothetical protein Cni_G12700 [Canna indica]